MYAKRVSGFNKGKSGNPNGRPLGTQSNSTKAWAKLRKLAVDDYEEAYQELRASMKNGEGWAYNIFFNKLLPKKIYMDTIVVEANEASGEARVESIIKQLPKFNELTHEEAISELITFNKLKEENLHKTSKLEGINVSFYNTLKGEDSGVDK